MATFRRRFPSWHEIVLVFAACAIPIYSWAIFSYFDKLPSWLLLSLGNWDLLGTFAYTVAFSLFESILVVSILVLLSALLPARFLREEFVALGSVLVLVTLLFAFVLQLNLGTIYEWSPRQILPWAVLYFVSLGVAYVLVRRFDRLGQVLNALAERLTILLYLYVPLSILGVVIVLIRNLQRG